MIDDGGGDELADNNEKEHIGYAHFRRKENGGENHERTQWASDQFPQGLFWHLLQGGEEIGFPPADKKEQ